MVTHCISSHMMSHLLEWRNPQGREEEWLELDQRIENCCTHLKVISTEIGLAILTTSAIIETIAYTALATAFFVLTPITNKPYQFFAKLLESSFFTIIWGTVDGLIYNPFFVNVMTRESFARYYASLIHPTSIEFFRLEDRLYIAEWQQLHRPDLTFDILNPIISEGQSINTQINQGIDFMIQEVFANASSETLDLCEIMDPSIFMFVLTKAIYIYAAGSKQNEPVPAFFKPATIDRITILRRDLNSKKQEVLEQLQQLIVDPASFEVEPQNEDVKILFKALRTAASGEFTNSLLSTKCWSMAIEKLANQSRAT